MGGMAWRWLASVPPTCTGLDSQARFHSRSSCDDATLRSLELGGSQLESSSRARRISTLTPKSSSTASRGATPKGAFPHGRAVAKRLGWDDVRDVPDGTRIRRPVLDDTLPGGPVERIVEYVAPFGTADREHDYAVAWAEFERRAAGAAG